MANTKKIIQAAAGSAGGGGLDVNEVFSTYLYDGNSSTRTITNDIDLSGEGGLVWIKGRDTGGLGASQRHSLYDTERGVTKRLMSQDTGAEFTESTGLTAFNTNGFDIGTDAETNQTSYDYASWTFRKAPKFFDVVTYTGDGASARQISHSLNSTIGAILIKSISNSDQWYVYHKDRSGTQVGILNETYAFSDFDGTSYYRENSYQTSSEFGVGSYMNASGISYVAYLFAHNDGDGDFGPTGDQDIIKCGSYTGNGSTDGPEINLGWEPQWVMTKAVSLTRNWIMGDIMRGAPVSGNGQRLAANLSDAELSEDTPFIPQATGFKVRSNSGTVNDNGQEYIYMAIRRGLMGAPEDATDVFYPDAYTGTSSVNSRTATGFPPDFLMGNNRSAGTIFAFDKLRGPRKVLKVSDSSAENTSSSTQDLKSFDQLGYTLNASDWNTNLNGGDDILWNFRRARSFFDAFAYTGDGTNGRTVNHNLGVVPELVITKRRDSSGSWFVLDVSSGKRGNLENANNFVDVFQYGYFGDGVDYVAPTDVAITYGSSINSSGAEYIAYLFASADGVSKVGSYTGTGSTQTIDCGFSSGARFVLIKCTNAAENWIVFDSARGIVSGNDPLITLNTTDAENTSQDLIDPVSSGFAVNTNSGEINNSSNTYIYLAIA